MSVHEPATRSQAFPDPIPGLITFGSVNLFAGASGVGKTCLLAWLLTQLRDGKPVFEIAVNTPPKIGYICADRGFNSAKYWLGKAGYLGIPFYSLADDAGFNTSRLRSKVHLIKILGECLDKLELPPGALAAIDPLALFMGGNLNDYMNCAVACIEIRRECTRRQITMIGTAHASKQKTDKQSRYQRLQDRILGSSAQLGYGDTQLYLASPEETNERFFTFLCHSHTSPPQIFPLGRRDDGMFVPWAESTQAAEEGAVYKALPEDGSTIGLTTILGLCSDISQATVFRRLQELIDQGLVERVAKGQYRRRKVH